MISLSSFLEFKQFWVVKNLLTRMKKHLNRGFTIVELLIVIVVIGILATIVIVAYNGIQQRAHVAVLNSDLSGAITTLGIANAKNGTYPADLVSAGLKASPGTTYQYTYTSSTNSYCITATGSGVAYMASPAAPSPTLGVCPGHTAPGGGGGGGGGAVPTIVAGSGSPSANAANYGNNSGPSITTPTATQVGDVTIIVGYVEPNNESHPAASYGNMTLPSGVTLANGFPIESAATHITTDNDLRMYVWYYYASATGSKTLSFADDQNLYWGLASATIHGGPTSGNPFADTPATATLAFNASTTTTPSVSLTTAGNNSLVLWAYTDWDGSNSGYPTGFIDVTHAPNEAGQPAIGSKIYSTAGSTGAIVASRDGAHDGMAAALLSLRAP